MQPNVGQDRPGLRDSNDSPPNDGEDDDEEEPEAVGEDEEDDDDDKNGKPVDDSPPMDGNTIISQSQLIQLRLEEQLEIQRKNKIKRQKEIYNRLNDVQRNRYVAFIQGAFKQTHVKKVMLPVLGTSKATEPLTIVMIAISKMFVGDLIELSLEIMSSWGHEGAIRPVHLREAYRRLQRRMAIRYPRRLFL